MGNENTLFRIPVPILDARIVVQDIDFSDSNQRRSGLFEKTYDTSCRFLDDSGLLRLRVVQNPAS